MRYMHSNICNMWATHETIIIYMDENRKHGPLFNWTTAESFEPCSGKKLWSLPNSPQCSSCFWLSLQLKSFHQQHFSNKKWTPLLKLYYSVCVCYWSILPSTNSWCTAIAYIDCLCLNCWHSQQFLNIIRSRNWILMLKLKSGKLP